MLFKTSVAFKEGFFAAGDPLSFINPIHYMRMWSDREYGDGVEFAYYATLHFNGKPMPVYIGEKK